jgi:hypothetical protein
MSMSARFFAASRARGSLSQKIKELLPPATVDLCFV